MIEDFVIHMVLAVILKAVKNPAHAASLKTALLNVRDEINTLYPGS